MKKFQLLTIAVIATTLNWTTATAQSTSPKFSIASEEYTELSDKSMDLFSSMNFDAWAETLSEDIIYAFPDGDVDTRTTLKGKKAVLDWWKNWQKTSGIKSMTVSEVNNFAIDATDDLKGGAMKGVYTFSYFSNKLEYAKGSVSIRMNFVTHFNADKKIDRYFTYYDRSKIIEAAGGNALKK